MTQFTASVTARRSAEHPYTLVELAGEADTTASGQIREVLRAAASEPPRRLIVDLSALTFMDSAALHAILYTNRALTRQGRMLALVNPQAAVRRVLDLTEAGQLLPIYDSLADATAQRGC